MNLSLYSRIVYIGPNGLYADVNERDVGYIIEDYGDGNFEVEFSGADGSTKAQFAIPEGFLKSAEI